MKPQFTTDLDLLVVGKPDGATAPVTASPAAHRYAVDGTYPVRLIVTTRDGRTGTVTAAVTVATHDVSITKFSTPAMARTGETKPIANTRYRESVTTDPYKSDRGSWTLVGALSLDVPARPDRTGEVPVRLHVHRGGRARGQGDFPGRGQPNLEHF